MGMYLILIIIKKYKTKIIMIQINDNNNTDKNNLCIYSKKKLIHFQSQELSFDI